MLENIIILFLVGGSNFLINKVLIKKGLMNNDYKYLLITSMILVFNLFVYSFNFEFKFVEIMMISIILAFIINYIMYIIECYKNKILKKKTN